MTCLPAAPPRGNLPVPGPGKNRNSTLFTQSSSIEHLSATPDGLGKSIYSTGPRMAPLPARRDCPRHYRYSEKQKQNGALKFRFRPSKMEEGGLYTRIKGG